ncbi:Si-specific NAD(P)(+) transhydrogenase [Ruficoccus amylovorans]|uniref:Soluble pyridine nucleotide transhydrogenase n=1 Tax=Ruficoccus amylovorans TaxID=1804625 RepID=A0A842HCG5_9BACT|nr:Si-specific NAD(P)(+) transhydrogenase [Ruficoccus amylovorans]MBC2594112.1 Si-specific NAD(P)(+) transhydrogenase [Ruficoccus amylovorans]
MKKYDLIIIGSGPAGEKAAVKAAYYGKQVAVVEKRADLGGAGTNTGTLPSKTLKETALYYSGLNERGLFGVDKELERAANVRDFFFRKNQVVEQQEQGIAANFKLHNIDTYIGTATVKDPHTVVIEGKDAAEIEGEFILVATGSYPFQPPGIPFDGKFVHDSDTILNINRIPRSIVIVGAGVIGCEYATIFAVMGTKVKLVNSHEEILGFLDREICRELTADMEKIGIEFVFGSRIEQVEILPEEHTSNVHAKLTNGAPIEADMFLYAAGRSGASHNLGLEALGVEIDNRQNIVVDEKYSTKVPSIYAAGDVIGFPALASTSMDQGRVAVTHMFNFWGDEKISEQFPYGIYTIPEVSVYGMTEDEAQKKKIDYCIGRARYRDMPRGRIIGAKEGLLKLVVDRPTRKVLGVHIFGKIATELIHYGMDLVQNEDTLGRIVSRVYNTPTLHELYKYAAYNALIEGHYMDEPTGN